MLRIKISCFLIFLFTKQLNSQVINNINAKKLSIENYKDSNIYLEFKDNILSKYINIDSSVIFNCTDNRIRINLNVDSSYGKSYNQIYLEFGKKIILQFNNTFYDFDSLIKYSKQTNIVKTSKTTYYIDQVLHFSFGTLGAEVENGEIACIYFRTFKCDGKIALQKWFSGDYTLIDYSVLS